MGLFRFLKTRKRVTDSFTNIRKGAPDSEFMGEFLVFAFVAQHFGLSDERLDEIVQALPDEVRESARLWVVTYLCWIFRLRICERYGNAFFDRSLKAARQRFAKGEDSQEVSTKGYADYLDFWLKQLDKASSNVGTSFEGKQVPLEVFAAWSFLALDPDTPYYQKTEFPGQLDFDVAEALTVAKQDRWASIERIVDIGGPIDDKYTLAKGV